MSRASVKAGACMLNGNAQPCAIQGSDCPDNTIWTSPRVLQPAGNSHGGHCTSRNGLEKETEIGFCPEGCASDASACVDPLQFTPPNQGSGNDRCTIIGQEATSTPTQFGTCNGECFWSDADCLAGETFQAAQSSTDCPCENVKTGACLYDGFYWCAVSESACDAQSQWISARDLPASGGPNCFLCREDHTAAPPAPTAAPVAVIVSEPTAPSVIVSISSEDELARTVSGASDSSSAATGVIVGAVAGGVIGLAILILAVFILRRSNKPSYNPNKVVGDIPLETEFAAPQHVDPSEDLSDDEHEGNDTRT